MGITKHGCCSQDVQQLLINIPRKHLRYFVAGSDEAEGPNHPQNIFGVDLATNEATPVSERRQACFKPEIQDRDRLYNTRIWNHHTAHAERTRNLEVAVVNRVEEYARKTFLSGAAQR